MGLLKWGLGVAWSHKRDCPMGIQITERGVRILALDLVVSMLSASL